MTIHSARFAATPAGVTDDDDGVSAFLVLGDDLVRTLTDALQRLDLLRGILDDTESTLPQQYSAREEVRELFAAVELDVRSAKNAMLSIAGAWPMSAAGRSGALVIRSTPIP
ncbi:hypothetical protein [Nocardia huaxiensis]|uniref:Uncharacterized protein n=1 Tax=Nocardia huaxiensis TaxID=2755382 RepID=A0A7D6VFI5_9NOCA|nr:hypothetical protein [Nocardia huaxiensis]QLY31737.1 hypothetical protein H0264_05310 [Nocardia huaxiensis]UFS95293.1 hypothetical protein LPY97_32125 [Nocardia huaxiensis]